MEKIINVDISNRVALYEIYNDNFINKNLLNYLIDNASACNKKDRIRIIIDNNAREKVDFEMLIKNTLKHQLNKEILENKSTNIKELKYTIVGVLALILYFFVSDEFVLNELILIMGWVLICEVLDIEFFKDLDNKKRRKTIKLLMKAEIEVK